MAQTPIIGKWNAHPSLSSILFLSADEENEQIWAASKGGFFRIKPGDNRDFDIVSVVDGLYLPESGAFYFDPVSEQIWLGFIDGMLQSYHPESGMMNNFNDIFRNTRFPSKQINHITSKGNTLYISTDFGLVLWNTKENIVLDSYVNLGDAGNGIKISQSAFMGDTLFLATSNGLAWANMNDNLFLPSSWKTWLTNEGDLTGSPVTIGAGTDSLFVSTSNKNLVYTHGKLQTYVLFPEIITWFQQQNETLFAISSKYIYENKKNGFMTRSLHQTLSGTTLNSVVYFDQHFFAGTQTQGVIGFRTNSTDTTSYNPSGPFLNLFSNLKMDGEILLSASSPNPGQRYSAYEETGFYLFDGEQWSSFNNANTTSLKSVDGKSYFLSAFSDSYYAFGSWGKGIAIYDKTTKEIKPYLPANTPQISGIDSSPLFMVVTGLEFDHFGYLWATNYLSSTKSLYRFDIKNNEWLGFPKSALVGSTDQYYGLNIDSFGQFWIPLFSPNSNQGRGLFVYDIGDPSTHSDDKGIVLNTAIDQGYLPSDMVTAVAQDKKGEIWVGTTRGLVRFVFPDRIILGNSNDRRAEYLRNAAGDSIYFRDISVSSIAVDAANQKWIGTGADGLWQLSSTGNEILKRYNTQNSPLPSNNILSVTINDKQGIIYVATDLGLISFADVTTASYSDRKSLKIYPNPVIYDKLEQNRIIIEGLAQETTVRVLSANGDLVDEISASGGRIQWIPQNRNGSRLSTGVYFVISLNINGEERAVGKFAVIR